MALIERNRDNWSTKPDGLGRPALTLSAFQADVFHDSNLRKTRRTIRPEGSGHEALGSFSGPFRLGTYASLHTCEASLMPSTRVKSSTVQRLPRAAS